MDSLHHLTHSVNRLNFQETKQIKKEATPTKTTTTTLKIGQNYTRWATILGMGVDHKLSLRAKYEIAYDKTTGEAAPGDSEGANPDDYVWEYVETCTAAMQPCRREQVPSLITASPIPTLNHQSPPQTVQAHHHQ